MTLARRSFRRPLYIVLALVVMGCSPSFPPELAGPWITADGDEVDISLGRNTDDHCDYGDAVYLEIPADSNVPAVAGDRFSRFTTDPQRIIFAGNPPPRTYSDDAVLPGSAVTTGYGNEAGREMWYDSQSNALYLVAEDGNVMRLPRGAPECD